MQCCASWRPAASWRQSRAPNAELPTYARPCPQAPRTLGLLEALPQHDGWWLWAWGRGRAVRALRVLDHAAEVSVAPEPAGARRQIKAPGHAQAGSEEKKQSKQAHACLKQNNLMMQARCRVSMKGHTRRCKTLPCKAMQGQARPCEATDSTAQPGTSERVEPPFRRRFEQTPAGVGVWRARHLR